MKLFYKKDYHYALIKISDLELKNNRLSTENNNLITQNRLLLSDNEKSIDEIKSLKLQVAELEKQLKNSYTLKKVGSGRPVKPQTMKIKSSVTSRGPVRKYLNKEFNYEES